MKLTEMTEQYAHGSLHRFTSGGKEKTCVVLGSAIQAEVVRGEKEVVFVVRLEDIRTGKEHTRKFTVR